MKVHLNVFGVYVEKLIVGDVNRRQVIKEYFDGLVVLNHKVMKKV